MRQTQANPLFAGGQTPADQNNGNNLNAAFYTYRNSIQQTDQEEDETDWLDNMSAWKVAHITLILIAIIWTIYVAAMLSMILDKAERIDAYLEKIRQETEISK